MDVRGGHIAVSNLHRIYPVTFFASVSAFGDIGNPLLTLVVGYIPGTTK